MEESLAQLLCERSEYGGEGAYTAMIPNRFSAFAATLRTFRSNDTTASDGEGGILLDALFITN